jgi:hypothetical protein
MQKGQIVRKCLSNGTIVGAYWMVIGVKRPNLVNVQSLASEKIREFVRKDRLHVCKTVKLIISHRVYDRVEKEVQNAIIHDSTKKWLDLFEKQPDIVQLRSELYEERTMLFCVDQTIKIQTENGIRIRLDLGEKIL